MMMMMIIIIILCQANTLFQEKCAIAFSSMILSFLGRFFVMFINDRLTLLRMKF